MRRIKWTASNGGQVLKAHNFHISRGKTEYTKYEFNRRCTSPDMEVKIGNNIIPQVTQFKYLGFIIQNNREEEDVNYRMMK